MIERPQNGEYHPYFDNYISLVKEGNILNIFDDVIDETVELLNSIPEEKFEYRYQEGKWSIKELVGHIADTYLVFAYRALRISRKDNIALPGYDENLFASNSNHNEMEVEDLIDYLENTAELLYSLIGTMSQEMLKATGNADGNNLSVRSIMYIMTGHTIHHLNVLKERYLN